jgi:hypothetical protein
MPAVAAAPPEPSSSGLSAMSASVVSEQRRDRRCVLQRRAGDLGRVDDAGLDQVDVLARGGVEADGQAFEPATPSRPRRRPSRPAFSAICVSGRLDGDLARCDAPVASSPLEASVVERLAAALQQGARRRRRRCPPRRPRWRRVSGVFDAVLLLLQLDLGRGADLDDGNAAGQLGQALLELLAVVVGVGVVDLGAGSGSTRPSICVVVAGAVDDRGVVLGRRRRFGAAEQVEAGVLELQADLLA